MDRNFDNILDDSHVLPEIETLEHHAERSANTFQLARSDGAEPPLPSGLHLTCSPQIEIVPEVGFQEN